VATIADRIVDVIGTPRAIMATAGNVRHGDRSRDRKDRGGRAEVDGQARAGQAVRVVRRVRVVRKVRVVRRVRVLRKVRVARKVPARRRRVRASRRKARAVLRVRAEASTAPSHHGSSRGRLPTSLVRPLTPRDHRQAMAVVIAGDVGDVAKRAASTLVPVASSVKMDGVTVTNRPGAHPTS
jgi:hypothetical protein